MGFRLVSFFFFFLLLSYAFRGGEELVREGRGKVPDGPDTVEALGEYLVGVEHFGTVDVIVRWDTQR